MVVDMQRLASGHYDSDYLSPATPTPHTNKGMKEKGFLNAGGSHWCRYAVEDFRILILFPWGASQADWKVNSDGQAVWQGSWSAISQPVIEKLSINVWRTSGAPPPQG